MKKNNFIGFHTGIYTNILIFKDEASAKRVRKQLLEKFSDYNISLSRVEKIFISRDFVEPTKHENIIDMKGQKIDNV